MHIVERVRADCRRPGEPPSAFMRFVIGYKIVGGILLLLLAGALFGIWRNTELFHDLRVVMMESNLGTNNRFLRQIAGELGFLTSRSAFGFGLVALFYCVVEFVEAFGLMAQKRWAEYLTALATSLFLPVEIIEVVRQPTVARVATFVINLAVVIYLVRAKELFAYIPEEHDASHN